MTWEQIWQKVVDYFNANAWNIFWFFIILVIGFIVITLLLMVLKRIMRRKRVDEIAIRFTATILRFCLFLLLILVLLHILGVPITGLTTTISAAVLAIGMALKEFLSNIASGIILVGSKKFNKGDYIQIKAGGGSVTAEGSIEDINILFTTLRTVDSTQITIPNNTMTNNAVVNLHAYPKRRVAITFPVAYDSDTKAVKKALLDVCHSCGLVYEDPEPLCRLKTLNDSSLDFFLTCFCDKEDYWDVYFYIMDYGFDALKAAGVNIPFPQVTISNLEPRETTLEHDGKLPDRVEKVREEQRKGGLTIEDLEDRGFGAMSDAFKEEAEQNKKRREKQKKEKEAKKAETPKAKKGK